MNDRICDKCHVWSKNLSGCLVILSHLRMLVFVCISEVYRMGKKSPISHRTLHIEQCGEKHLGQVERLSLLNRSPSMFVKSTVSDPGVDAGTSTANTPIGLP